MRTTSKLSNDPQFEARFWHVIGLYLDQPDRALGCAATSRGSAKPSSAPQPGLAAGIGHIRTKAHDYIRHGTVTLFAAFVLSRRQYLLPDCTASHHRQWLAFVSRIRPAKAAEVVVDCASGA